MSRGIIHTALTNTVPLELGYKESWVNNGGGLGEGVVGNHDERFETQNEPRSTELDWLLHLTW